MEIPAFLERGVRLMGEDAVRKLLRARVAVFGLGGVGGHCAEALARGGVGALTLVDGDVVAQSNLNRQLAALRSTLGMEKSRALAARLMDINPSLDARAVTLYYSDVTADAMPLDEYDYVADCVDDVPAKLLLMRRARAAGVPILSCMGAGNKLDPFAFRIAPLEKTSVCPLARAVRKQAGMEGIKGVMALYSAEPPRKTEGVPGSVQCVTACAGLMMASYIIKGITGLA